MLDKSKKLFTVFLFALTVSVIGYAQETDSTAAADKKATAESKPEETTKKKTDDNAKDKKGQPVKEGFSPAIADNSFLIEEAFNQEPGVVQHISTCMGFRKPQSDIACTFTQEWPVPNMKHQFSYTIPYSSLNANQFHGVGDVILNYRYQLKDEKSWAAISPRISLILPTGSTSKGLGTGSPGLQFNLPVSKRLSEKFVTHFNAGMTILPGVKGEDTNGIQFKRSLKMYNVGGSLIWLTSAKFNLMLEYLTNFNSDFDANGKVGRFKEHILNPGFRFAIDLGELQIVPGVAVPVSFSQGARRNGMFFYLSFEHPFSKQEKK